MLVRFERQWQPGLEYIEFFFYGSYDLCAFSPNRMITMPAPLSFSVKISCPAPFFGPDCNIRYISDTNRNTPLDIVFIGICLYLQSI